MNLCKYQGKYVRVVTTDEKEIKGRVIAFTEADEWDETDPNGDSISIENDQGVIGVYEKEIESIEVMKE